MDQAEIQPIFEIRSAIEQKPFENPSVVSFFTKWCEANDSIQPQTTSRDEWGKRGTKGLLEKHPNGKQTLYIPEDLQLWEMVGVIETIDNDTFASNPKRQTEGKEKLIELGKIFKNSGIYIAKRLNGISEGRTIAASLAQEFYEYGQSLIKGDKPKIVSNIDTIASQNLTPKETETIDRFLAGDTLYKSRQKRVEQALINNPSKKDEIYEVERQKTLSQFFRVAKKAFILETKSANGELIKTPTLSKPWQNNLPIHTAFLTRIETAIKQKIETPKKELVTSIFKRGMDLLQKNMPFDKLPKSIKKFYLHWQSGETTLRESLNIDKLKKELEAIRQTGDIEKISKKERAITSIIQIVVSRFPYESYSNNPSEMVAKQYINCVGASTLGGALMKEVGLDYLVGDVPEHSILLLVTSNGDVEWRDMLNPATNEKLTDEMIEGRNIDDEPLTIKDIIAFAHDSSSNSLIFDIKSDRYGEKLDWVKKGDRQYIIISRPESGHIIQTLNNIGCSLYSLGLNEEATEAYQRAINIDSKNNNYYPYVGLGLGLSCLHRYNEAIMAYQKAIAINPKDPDLYINLGESLCHLNHNLKAIMAYQKAIDLNPNYDSPYYYLGRALSDIQRHDEAVVAYQKAIAINPKNSDSHSDLGISLSILHRYDEAIIAYQKAIAINPTDSYSYHNLGRVLSNLNRHNEAIMAYQKAIIINPKNNYPYYDLGQALSHLNRNKQAIEAYQQFISLTTETKDGHWITQAKQEIAKLEKRILLSLNPQSIET